MIEAIIRKLNSPDTLVNYPSIMGSLQGMFQTNMSSGEIGGLVSTQLNGSKNWTIESISVDGAGTTEYTYTMGATPLYVMVPNQSTVDTAKQKIQSTLAN